MNSSQAAVTPQVERRVAGHDDGSQEPDHLSFHSRTYATFRVCRYALQAITVALSPAAQKLLDENVVTQLRERNNEKISKVGLVSLLFSLLLSFPPLHNILYVGAACTFAHLLAHFLADTSYRATHLPIHTLAHPTTCTHTHIH